MDLKTSEKVSVSAAPHEVRIHPLVLLSAVDHYTRINHKITSGRRVVGILLGSRVSGIIDIENSFAVPFEEDPSNPSLWYLDGNFLEDMFAMFRKVWARTRIVGWYSSGAEICPSDVAIHESIQSYCEDPVYALINVNPTREGMPATCYRIHERKESEDSVPKKSFTPVHTVLASKEAEEIGVDQLIRDLTDTTITSMEGRINEKQNSLTVLARKVQEMKLYLEDVAAGRLRNHPGILYNIQNIFNALPDLYRAARSEAMGREANDTALTAYVSSLTRCILSVGDLVANQKRRKKVEAAKATTKPCETLQESTKV